MNADLKKTFTHPPAIYRGAPFWAWNCKLDKDQLLRQIDCFKEMGLGGFHMHSRTGLDTAYLGDEFMEMVRACTDHAHENEMLAWLYDEDRWPSGAAGGLVTKDERYRARHLLFTATPYDENLPVKDVVESRARGGRYENGSLLARYAVRIADGRLAGCRRLNDGQDVNADEVAWYAYLETSRPSSWFNNETYVDTLNPDAIKRFVEITHERYAEAVGDEFGKTVPAIFTDEPQFVHKGRLGHASALTDVVIPWTADFAETYTACFGTDLLDELPELFWERADGAASLARYRYHDHVAERFAEAFADTIGAWCRSHGIALTGHLMEEPTLRSQTAAVGDAMRSYRGFDIPGIDVLCDRVESEFSTAKQAQSAAHQYGYSGVLSELYGVTNWDFDFAGHKRQGDWQAALGVAYRVHHLSWVSMAGEAKRDYPASMNYQIPWWQEYRVVENHFARVNAVLTTGKPLVNVGVIHPVESFWLCWGPVEQTQEEQEERDAQFAELIQWLLYGFIDFDFIAESLLPGQDGAAVDGGFCVGEMTYDVVLVPNMRTIRETTLSRLEAFAEAGGRVMFTGEVPSLVDAQPSDRPARLAERCETVPFTRTRLLQGLRCHGEVELLDGSGVQVHRCLHQLRQDGDDRYLFVCNTDRSKGHTDLIIRLKGQWSPTLLDTSTGATSPVTAEYTDSTTRIAVDLPAHGSIMLSLTPGTATGGQSLQVRRFDEVSRLHGPVPVTLSEPNVLLIDRAEFRIGDGAWMPEQPMLDIDPQVRAALDMPGIEGQMAQPWTDAEPVEDVATVQLRLSFESTVHVDGAELALETATRTDITLDGAPITRTLTGYFTDEAIQTVALPGFGPGKHTLVLSIPYTRKTYLEWIYLLGDFGVEVRGGTAALISPVRSLSFGDWVSQGLPFYAGNVTYHCSLPEGASADHIRVPHFRGAMVKVEQGSEVCPLAFAPFRAPLDTTRDGVDLTVYGTRINAFGQVHNCAWRESTHYSWWGPTSWRTKGDEWSDEYVLRPQGILDGPVLERANGQ